MEQRDLPVEKMEEGLEEEQAGLNFAHATSLKSGKDSSNESDIGVRNDVMVYYHHPQIYEKITFLKIIYTKKITFRKEYSFI